MTTPATPSQRATRTRMTGSAKADLVTNSNATYADAPNAASKAARGERAMTAGPRKSSKLRSAYLSSVSAVFGTARSQAMRRPTANAEFTSRSTGCSSPGPVPPTRAK
jgi:hypothetical protein